MAGKLSIIRLLPSIMGVLFLSASGLFSAVYYVAPSGNNANTGSLSAPFKTIQKAADVMTAGDTTYVRAGIYREYVQPGVGGTDESHRIVYKAYPGEIPSIRGSEKITGWSSQGNNVYSVELDDAFFGSFNPYTTKIFHTAPDNWLNPRSEVWHLGDVFINGAPLKERLTQQSVSDTVNSWYTSYANGKTTIYANFNGKNPNTDTTEVVTRHMVFYPSVTKLKYITVDGFEIKHAATKFCEYAGQTTGAIGVGWGTWWIIQNCRISDSKTAGITLGTIASGGGGDINNRGHHIVRNCIIERCGENGIYASGGGGASSIIEGNLIQDINYKSEIGGQESGCIKMHYAVDVIIRNNIFRRLFTFRLSGTTVGSISTDDGRFPGIWFDWGGMNSRITGNVFCDIDRNNIYLEANHGPMLIDNNIFINENERLNSEAVVNVHNLFIKSSVYFQNEDSRSIGWYQPHTFSQVSSAAITNTNLKFFNNMYFNLCNVSLAQSSLPLSPVNCAWDYNLFYKKNVCMTQPTEGPHSVTDASFDPACSYQNLTNGIVISFSMNTKPKDIACPLITSDYFGAFSIVNMKFENPDGSSITINRDIMGNTRTSTSPSAGPFENLTAGSNTFTITAGPDKTPGPIEYARPGINIAPMATATNAALNDRMAVEICAGGYNPTSGSYATFTWGYAQAMDMVRLHSTGGVPTSYDVEVSTDGSTGWTPVVTGITSWTAANSIGWAGQPHRQSAANFTQVVGKKGLRIKFTGSNINIMEVEILNNGGGQGGYTPNLVPKRSSLRTLNMLGSGLVSAYDMQGRLVAQNIQAGSVRAAVKNAGVKAQGMYMIVHNEGDQREKMVISR